MNGQQRLWQPMVLAFVLGLGFAVVWAMASGWALLTVAAWSRSAVAEGLIVKADGTVLVWQGKAATRAGRRLTDLEGNAVQDAGTPETVYGTTFWRQPREGRPFWRVPWLARIVPYTDGQMPAVYWYFVDDDPADEVGYFVGYNAADNRREGYIGTDGFRRSKPSEDRQFRLPARGYSIALQGLVCGQGNWWTGRYPIGLLLQARPGSIPDWVVHCLCKDGIYQVDLRNRTSRKVFDNVPERAVSMGLVRCYIRSPEHAQRLLAVRTASRVIVMDQDGQRVRDLRLPDELRGRRSFVWYELAGGKGLARVREPGVQADVERNRLYWFDANGKLLRSAEVELRGRRGRPPESLPLTTALIMPEPVAIAAAALVMYPADLLQARQAASNGAAVAKSLHQFWPALAGVHLVAAVLAWCCFRRQCRYAASAGQTVAWTAFVFLFGLPGLVGYWLHRRWPVLERCRSCSQTVPIDRPACAACGSALPQPELTGVEVFAGH